MGSAGVAVVSRSSRPARLDPYQLLRCVLAGGPGLARPFDVEDPPPPCAVQPLVTTWTLPSAPPAVLHRRETFDEALDRFSFVNRVARAELDDAVFDLRRKHWLLNGYRDAMFYRARGYFLPQVDGEEIEPIATDHRIIELIKIGFAFKGAELEENHA